MNMSRNYECWKRKGHSTKPQCSQKKVQMMSKFEGRPSNQPNVQEININGKLKKLKKQEII